METISFCTYALWSAYNEGLETLAQKRFVSVFIVVPSFSYFRILKWVGLVCIIALGASIQQCYYDRFDELHPLDGYVNTCDTTLTDNYSSAINLIMRANCTSCHNSKVQYGNISLQTYSDVMTQVTNGKLMGSILHQSKYKAMPPNTQLRDCEIQHLQNWINTSTPE